MPLKQPPAVSQYTPYTNPLQVAVLVAGSFMLCISVLRYLPFDQRHVHTLVHALRHHLHASWHEVCDNPRFTAFGYAGKSQAGKQYVWSMSQIEA